MVYPALCLSLFLFIMALRRSIFFLALLSVLILSGCASYYRQNQAFQSLIESGRMAEAQSYLEKNEKMGRGVNRVLYDLNLGTVAFLNHNYDVSIDRFKAADIYNEDYSKQLGYEALAMVSNPMVRPYKLESFEAVMLHFYQALGFLALNDYESALVECRRVNLQLQQLDDKYKNQKNRYARDAFAHNLMGIVYEAAGDFNNAFIAYRNAVDVYENDYKRLFGLDTPLQLKKDVIRAAAMTGFAEQVDFFERKFGLKYEPLPQGMGQVVCFWLNGLGPVKDEWSINFVNTGFNNGFVTLADEETGMSFPLFIGRNSPDEQNALANLRALRIAFPKYVARKPYFSSAVVGYSGGQCGLELAQDVNAIAFQSLKDRMWLEVGNSIMRLAVKKAMEEAVSSKNKDLGAVLSIVNAITEKADTRNWQSLPFSISYCRISLPEGEQKVSVLPGGAASAEQSASVKVRRNSTAFLTFSSF